MLAGLLMVGTTASQAGELDPATGRLAIFGEKALDFEPGVEPTRVGFRTWFVGVSEASQAAERGRALRRDLVRSLVGQHYLELGGERPYFAIELEPDGSEFSRRRVEVHLWQKALGTKMTAKLVWLSGDRRSFLEFLSADRAHVLAEVPLFPTGRVTSDGWRELSSGPVDFWLAGRIPPLLWLEDQQIAAGFDGGVENDFSARAAVDGIEIVDLGPAQVPARDCRASSSCGELGSCLYGRCVDAAAKHGPSTAPELFREYLFQLELEYRRFSGSRVSVQGLSAAVATVRSLEAQGAPVPKLFETWRKASVGLADGHYAARRWAYRWPVSLGVCAHLGTADASEGGAERPLVYDASLSPLAGRLRRGDVLRSVEGRPPLEWLAAEAEPSSYGGDPIGAPAIDAMEVLDRAAEVGARALFSRCPIVNRVCQPNEVLEIEIDLRQLLAGLWTDQPPEWRFAVADCDARLEPAVPDPQRSAPWFVGSRTEGLTRMLLINAVPGDPSWISEIDRALSGTPASVLLDQRRGWGGTVEGADALASRLVGPMQSFGVALLPAFDGDLKAHQDAFRACLESSSLGDLACGNAVWWQLGQSQMGPRSSLGANAKLAVLNYQDVSGNDYVSEFVSHRGAATRIFGPGPTYGAFGAIVTLPTRAFELGGGGSIQIHDSIFLRRSDDPNESFSTGRGVIPHTRVLQRQTDLIGGVDTVMEEARRWLRE